MGKIGNDKEDLLKRLLLLLNNSVQLFQALRNLLHLGNELGRVLPFSLPLTDLVGDFLLVSSPTLPFLDRFSPLLVNRQKEVEIHRLASQG